MQRACSTVVIKAGAADIWLTFSGLKKIKWVIIRGDVEFIKNHVIQRGYQYWVILQMQMKYVLEYNVMHKIDAE